ncbi:hypothetical protein [Thiofilum flexile]|uniref:hypothetical protein n=1 Tax=Thiofilum flexile TaxID=125627 RepID=UPI00035E31DE|nr:hypothetical protein [Thiofilum flexile]
MDINGINPSHRMGQATAFAKNPLMTPSSTPHINAFNHALHGNQKSHGMKNNPMISAGAQQLAQLQQQQQLMQMLQGATTNTNSLNNNTTLLGASINNTTQGSSTSIPGNEAYQIIDAGSGDSVSNSGLIPKPIADIQTLNLGGKSLKIGGDGTCTAEEVAATTKEIQNLYDKSPTFKTMIDRSANSALEVSVGRRADNISWGDSEGRVFMNINNVTPGNSDRFQALMGHEFAHATIDIPHGSVLEQIQNAVAQEA